MKWMKHWMTLKAMIQNKKGQGMVEYVLIIAFIALVVMLALTPLGNAIATKFNEVVTALN